jgi:hypothetical protein
VQVMRRVEHVRAQHPASVRASLPETNNNRAQGKELRWQFLSLHLQRLHREGGM